MSVYKRGKSWYVNLTLSGRRIHRKAGDTKRQAKDIEETLRTKNRLSSFHLSELHNDEVPFSFLSDGYFNNSTSLRSPRTHLVEKNYFDNHVNPYFETFITSGINDPILIDFQAKMKGKGLSNRTVNILLGIVRKILKHGESRHLIRPPVLRWTRLKESRRIHAFFSEDEFAGIASHIKDEITRSRVIIMRHTGMRPAEAAYLEWNDVDFDSKVIRIRSKEIKPGTMWHVKDREERTIPLNVTALQNLQRLYADRQSRWVFSRGNSPVVDIDKSLKSAALATGIARPVAPNMLRHTFAVLQLQRGANIEAIRKIMGHSDIRTTMRYLDCVNEELRNAVQ